MKFKDMPYERVNYEDIEAKFNELIKEFDEAKSGEEQFEVHKKYYAFSGEIATMTTIAHIRFDINTTDEFYSAEQDYYNEIMPKVQNLMVSYMMKLYESPYRDYLESVIGPVAFKNIELQLKSFDEKLIPLMQEENALTTEYSKLIAGAKIDWEGETLNLSLLGKYLTSSDREVRKVAHAKRSAWMKENSEALDTIYDKLVKNRDAQAKALGYKNYIELGYYRMQRNSYDKDAVKVFRDQVKEYFVPFAQKLNERRRQRLGIDKLYSYDEGVYFVNGNPAPLGDPDTIMKNGQKMYSDLSKETKEFFDFMTECELFDVLGRKTKRAGGYMTYLPKYNAPFIFANFNGTSGDVDVITHECGHAFQGYVSGKDPIREHADITMETAEIHSMSMEFFTEPYMEMFFGERTNDYIQMHLESSAAFIPYGCTVDEFQHIVYENPDMTPAERKEVWKKLEKEYKPYLDYGEDEFMAEGSFWQKQPHIYSMPFYYIDYCLAQTCAFQYKTWMDENYKEAWESYYKLCELSASDFFTNLLKQVGLESPFEEGSVEKIVNKLEEKMNL